MVPRLAMTLALLVCACFADHPPDLVGTGTSGGSEAPGTSADPTTGTSADPTTDGTGGLEGCPSTMPPGTWYIDQDGDSWGSSVEVVACDQPPGSAPEPGDCDEKDPDAHPGAPELCDGHDDDCDGLEDEFSAMNASCDGCTLAEHAGTPYWFCAAAIDWVAAHAACKALGATVELASLHDAAENSFAEEEALAVVGADPTGPFWIGLRRRDPDWQDCGADVAHWEWSDGTRLDFMAWSTGQPDNSGAVCDPACVPTDVLDETCAFESCGELLFAGGWNDGVCFGAGVGYACRAAAPP